MSDNFFHENNLSSFYIPIKAEVKHYSNILGILDKLELDKNLETMGESFTKIIASEISYAFDGRFIRIKET